MQITGVSQEKQQNRRAAGDCLKISEKTGVLCLLKINKINLLLPYLVMIRF